MISWGSNKGNMIAQEVKRKEGWWVIWPCFYPLEYYPFFSMFPYKLSYQYLTFKKCLLLSFQWKFHDILISNIGWRRKENDSMLGGFIPWLLWLVMGWLWGRNHGWKVHNGWGNSFIPTTMLSLLMDCFEAKCIDMNPLTIVSSCSQNARKEMQGKRSMEACSTLQFLFMH